MSACFSTLPFPLTHHVSFVASPADFALSDVSMQVTRSQAHWSCLGLGPHHLSPGRVEPLPRDHSHGLTTPLCSFLLPASVVFIYHYFVPYFLLFCLPANHFSAGDIPTQNCFKSFLEHGKIRKQKKTRNKSLLVIQTRAPTCLLGALPGPGDRQVIFP